MSYTRNDKRTATERKNNLIEFAIETLRNRKWLFDEDILILQDIFATVRTNGSGNWYEINSLISILTSKECLNESDQSKVAELLALIENYAEKHSGTIKIYADTYGKVSLQGVITAENIRTPDRNEFRR